MVHRRDFCANNHNNVISALLRVSTGIRRGPTGKATIQPRPAGSRVHTPNHSSLLPFTINIITVQEMSWREGTGHPGLGQRLGRGPEVGSRQKDWEQWLLCLLAEVGVGEPSSRGFAHRRSLGV